VIFTTKVFYHNKPQVARGYSVHFDKKRPPFGGLFTVLACFYPIAELLGLHLRAADRPNGKTQKKGRGQIVRDPFLLAVDAAGFLFRNNDEERGGTLCTLRSEDAVPGQKAPATTCVLLFGWARRTLFRYGQRRCRGQPGQQPWPRSRPRGDQRRRAGCTRRTAPRRRPGRRWPWRQRSSSPR